MINTGEYVSLVHSESPWFGSESSSESLSVMDDTTKYSNILYFIVVLIMIYLLIQYLGLF